MFGGTYFGEGYFAGEPATQQAQADNAPPAPVVPPVVPPPSNWAPSAFLTRLTADPVTIDALGVPLVARVQLAPSATPVPWMTRPRVTEPPSSVPVVPFIASLAPSRAIPVAPVIARSTADPVPDVPPAPLVARAVPAVFVPAPLVDRVTADPAPDAVKLVAVLTMLIFPLTLAYVVIVVVWAWANRVAIRATEFPIAVVGLGFFALSVLLDQEVLGISRGPFFEDTPKIIGICLWALWLMRSAIRLVRSQRDLTAEAPAAV